MSWKNTPVSFVQPGDVPRKNAPAPSVSALGDCATLVAGDGLRVVTARIRLRKTKESRNELKVVLPAAMFAGTFSQRKKASEHFLSRSGFLCADLDHLAPEKIAEIMAQLPGNPHVPFAFRSPSGDGLKILFRVDPDAEHLLSWLAVKAYCATTYSVQIDENTKDLGRLSYLCRDKNPHIAADDFEPLPIPYPEGLADDVPTPVVEAGAPPAAPGELGSIDGLDENDTATKHAAAAFEEIEAALLSIPRNPPYDKWLRIASAVWDSLGEAKGCELLQRWSPEPSVEDYHSKFEARLTDVTAGTLFYLAAEHGFSRRKWRLSRVPALYFDGGSYWRKELDGTYGELTRVDAQLHLKIHGLSPKSKEGPSEIDQALFETQQTNRVHYAGAICGRTAGPYTDNGHKILATDSPRVIEADVTIDGAFLENFFRTLFGREKGDSHAEAQFLVFCGWLRRFREAIRTPENPLPGHALFLIGDKDAGKSFAQAIITLLTGGREAEGDGVLLEGEKFDEGVWRAEHVFLSDPSVGDSEAARGKFREMVKRWVANPTAALRPMYHSEITLHPVRRLTVATNADAESSGIVPSLGAALDDKIIYLKVYAPAVPLNDDTPEGRAETWKQVVAAAPGFLSLVETVVLPPELKGRFGVVPFVHPELATALASSVRDADLHERLESLFEPSFPGEEVAPEIELKASVLYDMLASRSTTGAFERRYRDSHILGMALGRLARDNAWKGRIVRVPGHAKTPRWRISSHQHGGA